MATVANAGDVSDQRVARSTVGGFLKEVDYKSLPKDRHMLFIGKFLTARPARKDALAPRAVTTQK